MVKAVARLTDQAVKPGTLFLECGVSIADFLLMCQNAREGDNAMKKNEIVKSSAGVSQVHEVDGMRVDHSFNIEVIYDAGADVWVAACDEIGLVTEEKSREAVIARANLVIPELIAATGFPMRDANYVLNYIFIHRETVTFN